jgi:hypothetical protein
MPVVVRNSTNSRGISECGRIGVAIFCCVVAFSTHAAGQEAAEQAPATPAPAPAAESDEAARQAAATKENVPANCVQQVLAEQQLTRTLREMREPLPYPDKNEAARLRRDYTKLLSDGFTNAADTTKVQQYLEWQLLRVTESDFIENPGNVQQLLKDIESDVQRAGANIGNPANQLTARKKFCGEVLTIGRKLLSNNFDARVACISILKALHEVRAVPGGAPAKLYPEALATLLDILNSKEQPDSVKVFVASALRNVLRNCDVIETEQFRICDAVAAELARSCTQSAYQQTLLETLFDVRRARKTVGGAEPTVMKSFAAVLDDRSRPVEVRCLAAMGIGRGAFDNQMRLDPLAWKIAQLAGDAAVEFNRSPGDSKWPACGASLIFAFRHVTNEEATAALLDRKGLLNRSGGTAPSKIISEAAPLVKVVGLKLIENGDSIAPDDVLPLAEWIQSNRPESLKWDDKAPDLTP